MVTREAQEFRVPTATAPYALLWALSWVDREVAFVLPSVGRARDESNSGKIRRMLGVTFRPGREIVRDCAASLVARGCVAPPAASRATARIAAVAAVAAAVVAAFFLRRR